MINFHYSLNTHKVSIICLGAYLSIQHIISFFQMSWIPLHLTHNITSCGGTSFCLFYKNKLLERDVFVPLYKSFQRKRKIFLISLLSAARVPRVLLCSLELVSWSATENTLQFQPKVKITIPKLPLGLMPRNENLFCLVSKIKHKSC